MAKFKIGDRVVFNDPAYGSEGLCPGSTGVVADVYEHLSRGVQAYQCLPDVNPYPEDVNDLWNFYEHELALVEE